MQLLETHIALCKKKPIRFQEYAVGIFNTVSTKSSIKKAIKKELIFIDGVLATTAKYIFGGEKIELYQTSKPTIFKKLKLNLEIVFEDDFLAVIYKPAGILVNGNKFVTIANALSQNLKKSLQTDAVNPKPIHRLDYATSGLLLIGKTNSAIINLSKMFENKEIAKTYHAITIGNMQSFGNINFTVDSKKAITYYKVLQTVISKKFGALNLVELNPKTGRKHQLRKHLLANNNPILGDKKYYLNNLILNGKGLYLHATKLEFIHPFTNKKTIVHKHLPKKFNRIFSVNF